VPYVRCARVHMYSVNRQCEHRVQFMGVWVACHRRMAATPKVCHAVRIPCHEQSMICMLGCVLANVMLTTLGCCDCSHSCRAWTQSQCL
jgi:hypothetical protein